MSNKVHSVSWNKIHDLQRLFLKEKAGEESTKNQVIEQTPEPGEYEEGTTVTFWINTGPDVKTIPSGIIGIPFENARAILNEAGFDNVKSEDAKPFDLDDSGTEPVNATKGNGFNTPENGGQDVFVHNSAVERAGLRELRDGQVVSYELVADRKTGKTSAGNLAVA